MATIAPHLSTFEGGNALPAFRAAALLARLQAVSPRITAVDARYVHWVGTEQPLAPQQSDTLQALLSHGQAHAGDDQGTLIRKHFLQLDGLGVRDLHFSGDDLYILAGPTMVLNGEIRVFKWPAAAPLLAANRDPVRFEEALTESVSLPHGRGTNRAEALCDLPPALSGGLPTWIVLYVALGADRKEVKHTVFGDLVRHK